MISNVRFGLLPSPALARATLLGVALCLTGCSASKTTKRSEFGPTYEERFAQVKKIIKNNDFSMRSSFEKQIPKSTTDKAYAASAYNAKDATGMRKFSGTDSAYHAKDFAGADKKSPSEQVAARETKQQNQLASRMFRTPDSRFDGKTSQDGEKPFTQAGETFATRENRAGTKELEKNKKPVILDPEKPTYSEDDVKRLLNKS